jgi:hypothetical protein
VITHVECERKSKREETAMLNFKPLIGICVEWLNDAKKTEVREAKLISIFEKHNPQEGSL